VPPHDRLDPWQRRLVPFSDQDAGRNHPNLGVRVVEQ
jgi:hypothetical protein